MFGSVMLRDVEKLNNTADGDHTMFFLSCKFSSYNETADCILYCEPAVFYFVENQILS